MPTQMLTGDFDVLRNWATIAKQPDKVLKAASAQLADESIARIRRGFVEERDPYGKPWASKKRPDGRKVLRGKTGRLRTGWHAERVSDGGYVIVPSVDYADPHQNPKRGADGKLKRPRRMMVPNERGLPIAWAEGFERIAERVLEEFYTTGTVRARRRRAAQMASGFETLVAAVKTELTAILATYSRAPVDVRTGRNALHEFKDKRSVVFVRDKWPPLGMPAKIGPYPDEHGGIEDAPVAAYEVKLIVEAHLADESDEKAEQLWIDVLNACRNALGTGSKPLAGLVTTQTIEGGGNLRAGNEHIVQLFEWTMRVPKLASEAQGYVVVATEESEGELVTDGP